MKALFYGVLVAFLPMLAVAQSQDVVTVIPDKGILLTEGRAQTFIPQGGIAIGQMSTFTAGGLKDFCSSCGCCIEVDARMVSAKLKSAGQGQLATDPGVLGNAVNIDMKKLPRTWPTQ